MIVKARLGVKGLLEARKEKRDEGKVKTLSEKSLFEKIDALVEYPFTGIRKLTIPPCEEEAFQKDFYTQKWLVLIWPWFGIPMAYYMMFLNFDVSWLVSFVYIGIALLWSGIWYWVIPRDSGSGIPAGYVIIAVVGMLIGFL